jgi:hypothetical protein
MKALKTVGTLALALWLTALPGLPVVEATGLSGSQTITVPGGVNAVYIELDDADPATPNPTVDLNGVNDLKITLSWSGAALDVPLVPAPTGMNCATLDRRLSLTLNTGGALQTQVQYDVVDAATGAERTETRTLSATIPNQTAQRHLNLCVR